MNDNNVYVVKGTQENFEDIKCLMQVFCDIYDIDPSCYCIKTRSLDGTMKKRLDDAGASFWQETEYKAKKTVTGRK